MNEGKSEIRNPKFETNSKYKCSKSQTKTGCLADRADALDILEVLSFCCLFFCLLSFCGLFVICDL